MADADGDDDADGVGVWTSQRVANGLPTAAVLSAAGADRG